MAWVKIDDNAPHHRKQLAAGPLACWLWVCSLAYCQKHATDGIIPVAAVPFLGCTGWKLAVPKLLNVGLWELDEPNGYRVHDFLHWNDSAAERSVKTESNRRRIELFRDKDMREFVKNRDRGMCRYCGVDVKWHDRRGSEGGTYDHVDPAAANTAENLVVCCRGCNSSKGRRTPADAGMVLIQIGSRSEPRQGYRKPNQDLSPPIPTPLPVQEQERTAAEARRSSPSVWKRAVAIAHEAIDAYPKSSPDQADAFKATCAKQGIDYGALGGKDSRPLYARALDYAAGVRARRAS